MAARKLMIDVKANCRSAPILELAGVTEQQLGTQIVESATVVGTIDHYGSVRLPRTLPVTIGCHDVSASLLSAGVRLENPDTIGVLMGTYEQMGYFSDTFVDGCNDFGDSLIFSCCYSSPFNNKYTVMDASQLPARCWSGSARTFCATRPPTSASSSPMQSSTEPVRL